MTTRPALSIALVSALLALVTMRIVGTPVLDPGAYRIGVGLAAAAGLVTSFALAAVEKIPRLRRTAWALVLGVGALVGIAMQVVLLVRKPELRTYVLASGLTTADPFGWSLAGAPLGAIPAVVVAVAVAVASRLASPIPAGDDRERLMLPFAATCAVVAGAANGFASDGELPLTLGLSALALAALAEIRFADFRRARWLRKVYAGEDPEHEVVPLATYASAMQLPRAVAGAPLGAVILRHEGERGYRQAMRSPVAASAASVDEALAPILRRRSALAGSVVASLVALGIALLARGASY